jgi:hypothetical protein
MVMGKEASAGFFLLIGGGERERGRSWSRTSATVGQRLSGLAEPRRGVGFPALLH